MENEVLAVDPMARMRRPHVAQGKPRPLTPAQVDLLLTASRGNRNANVGAWLTLGLYAGLRAHEIAKIRGEDVTEDTIYVRGKGGVDAEIPTHPVVWALALGPAANRLVVPNLLEERARDVDERDDADHETVHR